MILTERAELHPRQEGEVGHACLQYRGHMTSWLERVLSTGSSHAFGSWVPSA